MPSRRCWPGSASDTVFGVVGSGNFHVTNALIERGARFVAARHECGAASMADGWARITGRPGIVSLHQGPGPDQRADRHHRGGQEPDADGGAGRRRGGGQQAVQLQDRRGRRWPGASGRSRPSCTPPASRSTTRSGRTSWPPANGARSCSRCRSTSRPPSASRRPTGRCRPRCRPGPGPPAGRPTRRRPSAWPPRSAGPQRPVFIAGRGARVAGRQDRARTARRPGRRAAGHLGGGQGPVPR